MKTTNYRPLMALAACLSVPAFGQALDDKAFDAKGDSVKEDANRADAAERKRAENLRGLEEVIVTAQKREEKLQDVPISIAVLSGKELDAARGNGLLEALAATPSVSLNESGVQAGTTLLGIRGVNATASFFNGSSPIGFYFDSLPFGLVRSAPIPNLTPYDLDRVEVLRGPQGTLYGATSLNGVVRVLTKDPDLETMGVKAQTSVASTQGGSESYRGDFAANVPIISGKLAARVVAGYEDRGGWIDTPNRTDVNDAENTNVRLKVKAQATDDLSVVLSGWRYRSDLGASNLSDINYRRGTDDKENASSDFDTASLLIKFNQASYTLSSATSYLDYTASSDLSLAELGLVNAPLFDYNINGKLFAQEFLINSSASGPWLWSAGLFYRDAEENLFQIYAKNDLTYESKSIAYFGQLTRLLFGQRLELTAGLRYFEDKVDYRDNPGIINVSPPYVTSSEKFDKVSPRITATWHLNSDATVYASYSEGFRSGFSQFSTVTRIAPEFPPAGPDQLASYEIGSKGNLASGRINYEAAVYYLDWEDTQQVVSFVDTRTGSSFPTALNTGAIDGTGVDLSVNAEVLPRLSFAIDYSWNDLAFTEPVFSGGQVMFEKGFRPPLSAKETFGASIAYNTSPFGSGWVGSAQASVDYTSEIGSTQVVNGVASTQAGDAVLLARTSIGLEAPGNWAVLAYVDNLTDKHTMQSNGGSLVYWNNLVRPRTYGLQLTYRFQER